MRLTFRDEHPAECTTIAAEQGQGCHQEQVACEQVTCQGVQPLQVSSGPLSLPLRHATEAIGLYAAIKRHRHEHLVGTRWKACGVLWRVPRTMSG